MQWRSHVGSKEGHGHHKIFEKKKVDILKYELSLPIKQFSRLDMLLAPQISNKYLEIPQSQLFQQIKGKKKILVKKQF